MSNKWERRQEKKDSKKNRMPKHGRSTITAILNRLNKQKYADVQVGTEFLDEKHNRHLRVHSRHPYLVERWMCENTLSDVEVLYAYTENFIKKNKIAL